MWIFLLIFLLVIATWGTYLGFRLIKPLGLAPLWTRVLWGLMYLPMLIPIILLLRENLPGGVFSRGLEAAVFTSLALYSFMLGLSLFRDTAAVLLYSLSRILRKPDLNFFSSGQVLKSSCLTVIGASLLMVTLGLFNALSIPGIKEETYFITGNHEYYSGYDGWIKYLKTFGFRILLDEHTVFTRGSARILLAGVTDPASAGYFPGRPRGVEVAVQGAPETDLRILLAHRPGEIHDAEKFGFDLQLSGHTHGGQFFPWNYVVGFFHPYVKGLNRHGNTWIYVSQGIGFWGPPIRLGTRSEITLLILKRTD